MSGLDELPNSVDTAGFHPYDVFLKHGAPYMLLRNINPQAGLRSGNRVPLETATSRIVRIRIAAGAHMNELHFSPRAPSITNEGVLSCILTPGQFLKVPAFVMELNKSRGQAFKHVSFILPTPAFACGQLYVASSRATHRDNLRLMGSTPTIPRRGIIAQSVIYPEALLGRLLNDHACTQQ